MNLILRLIRVVVMSFFRSRLGVLDVSVVNFRVWPNDMDFNGHMNNGRYLTVMDLGRIDLILRAGLGKYFLTGKWVPIVASAKLRYRRSLGPFQKYQLHSRLLCWDDKWFILEQRFMVDDRSVAIAYIKSLFRERKSNIAPAEILLTLGHTAPSPPVPESVQLWMESESHIATD